MPINFKAFTTSRENIWFVKKIAAKFSEKTKKTNATKRLNRKLSDSSTGIVDLNIFPFFLMFFVEIISETKCIDVEVIPTLNINTTFPIEVINDHTPNLSTPMYLTTKGIVAKNNMALDDPPKTL